MIPSLILNYTYRLYTEDVKGVTQKFPYIIFENTNRMI